MATIFGPCSSQDGAYGDGACSKRRERVRTHVQMVKTNHDDEDKDMQDAVFIKKTFNLAQKSI